MDNLVVCPAQKFNCNNSIFSCSAYNSYDVNFYKRSLKKENRTYDTEDYIIGFVDVNFNFLTPEEAFNLAYSSKQITDETYGRENKELLPEDLN